MATEPGARLSQEDWAVVERISVRARQIRIELRAPREVRLVIPRNASRREAYAFLESRREWISRRLGELGNAAPEAGVPPMRWDGRDELPLFGEPRRVEIHPARLKRPQLRIADHCIALYVPNAWKSQGDRLRAFLIHALRERARDAAREMLDEESARLGLPYSGLRIADQKTLWGSCTWDGRISLNWRLLMAPREAFRYVVVHELCHLRWRSHGPRFWALLARQMPDYEQHRQWLREHGGQLQAALALVGEA